MTGWWTWKRPRAVPAAGLLLLAAALLPGCAAKRTAASRQAPAAASVVVEAPQPEPEWRALLRPEDGARIDGVAAAWTEALAAARRAGAARRMRTDAKLLDPHAALPRSAPPPGSYRCRVIRISAGRRGYGVTGPFFCFVGAEDARLSFTRQTGSDRPGGYLYEDEGAERQIFVGASARGREKVPPPYGNPERDVAGIVERIDNFRYRLVIPRPRGAILEVYELVPAL